MPTLEARLTAAAYTAYIQNFGGGVHVAEARQRVAELSRKEADEKAWADADKAGTAAAFNGYIQKFGSGAHVAEARQRLAALDEQARKEADEKPSIFRKRAKLPPVPCLS